MTFAGHTDDAPARLRKRASMREVADLADVAMSSVSRVLSGHPDVSPEMRVRVMSAVERLGYKPNMLAQSLRRRETRSVGFVVGDISNPLLAAIIKGAETRLREAGYAMLLTSSEGDAEFDAAHILLLEQRLVDGLVLSTAREDHAPTNEILARLDIPVVMIDRNHPESVAASRVLSDHRAGMRAALDHLYELGHRRIGLVVGQPVRPSLERRRGLEDAWQTRGLGTSYQVVEGTFSVAGGAAGTRSLLDSPEPPTAIITGGNQLLIGALHVMAERGLAVGRDLSVVSCDDIAVTELHRPAIAVIRRDTEGIGRTAAELLLRLANGEEPSEITLPTEFVARPSCAPPSYSRDLFA